jgi:hypothetical protein
MDVFDPSSPAAPLAALSAIPVLGLLLGGGWASGINLYLTIAALGFAQRSGWITLPGSMQDLATWPVIGVASLLFLVEFVADKIPLVDSAWDTVHTIIRPLGGAALGFLAMIDAGPGYALAVALLTGAIALDAHLTKATTRAAINTSPEPVSNAAASVVEDVSVVGVLILAVRHPLIAVSIVLVFVVASIWFLRRMARFLGRVLRRHRAPAAAPPG